MAGKYNICLDIGGTKVLGVIFDENRNIVYKLKKKTKSGGDTKENVEQVIVSVVEEMLEKASVKKKDIRAIAAGAPGVIDSGRGVVLFSPNLPWRDYDIKTPMEKKFGAPFYIGNDVNVGVLGEYKYGAARGYHNVVGTRRDRCADADREGVWRHFPARPACPCISKSRWPGAGKA